MKRSGIRKAPRARVNVSPLGCRGEKTCRRNADEHFRRHHDGSNKVSPEDRGQEDNERESRHSERCLQYIEDHLAAGKAEGHQDNGAAQAHEQEPVRQRRQEDEK